MLDHARIESAVHLDAMRKFARAREIAEAWALEIYERERSTLSQGAKVKRFVGILAEKRAKAALVRLEGN